MANYDGSNRSRSAFHGQDYTQEGSRGAFEGAGQWEGGQAGGTETTMANTTTEAQTDPGTITQSFSQTTLRSMLDDYHIDSNGLNKTLSSLSIEEKEKTRRSMEEKYGDGFQSRIPSYGSLAGLGLPQLSQEAPGHGGVWNVQSGTRGEDEGVMGDKEARDLAATNPFPVPFPVQGVPTTNLPPPEASPLTLEAGTGAGAGAAGEGMVAGDEEGYKRLSTIRTVFLTIAMLMTYFLGTASSTSPTVLIPSIARDLGYTELETQWVASAYTLAFGCGLLFSGRLADIFGRRRLYLIGLVIYIVFAIMTGAIKHRLAMCITRAFSGLGLSISSPAGFGIIGVNIRHEPARTIVFASFGLGNPVGAAFGGLLGGTMAGIGSDGWSYLFYLLAGLCAVIGVVAWFAIPADRPRLATREHDRRIDWVGGALVTAAICLFTFSLTDSGIAPRGWASPHVPALFITSLILFTLFFFWSRHLETRTSYPPIIKPSLFTRHSGRISSTCLCAFFSCLSVYGFVYSTTAFYQNYMGLNAFGNALRMMTCNVTGIFAAGGVMVLAPRFKTPHLLAVGGVMTGAASLMYALRPEGLIYWAIEFPAQLLLPWGIDFAIGLGNILVSNLVTQDEQSVGGALFQTSAQVGAALGICLSALVTSQVNATKGDLLEGIRAAFWFCAATSLIVSVVALTGLRKVGLARDVAH